MYEEDEFLQLSGIQHFSFCRRQWALAYIELQWNENVRTVEGHLLHERAHDRTIAEKRGDIIVSRAMPVHSRDPPGPAPPPPPPPPAGAPPLH